MIFFIDAIDEINVVFSIQVILMINQLFLFLTYKIFLQLIPVLLLVMISMIFTVYSLMSEDKTGVPLRLVFIILYWNIYQLIPVVVAIYKASKVVETAKQMSDTKKFYEE